MAEYMDLSEPRSPKFFFYTILAWVILCVILMVGAGIRELKDSRSTEKVQIEQTSENPRTPRPGKTHRNSCKYIINLLYGKLTFRVHKTPSPKQIDKIHSGIKRYAQQLSEIDF